METFSSDQHLAPEDLLAFASGILDAEKSNRVSKHLVFCPACRLAFVETMKSVEPLESVDQPKPIAGHPNYSDFEHISSGGMGIVYRAVDKRTGKVVAIKRIAKSSEEAYGSNRKHRMVRESRALLGLDHPNIVKAIEMILIGDAPALVMEFVSGRPLQHSIRKEIPSPLDAAKIARQLADAIAHAHRHGVIHGDLKPHNVLVSQDGEDKHFKLIDFGLAKLVHEDWQITQSGDVLGTPAYIAPELTTGKSVDPGPAIDIYGLGAILYELLTGHAPFDAPTPTALLVKVGRDKPDLPSKLRPGIPAALERICMKCLEKRPEDRYASAQSLEQDLQAFLDNNPVSAKGLPPLRRFSRLLQANRVVSSLLLTTALMAMVGGGMLWKKSRQNASLSDSVLQAIDQKRQAQDSVLEELRNSLEEITERLYGSTPEEENQEWQALDRISKRWSRFAQRMDDSQASRLVESEALMRIGTIQTILGDLQSAESKLLAALESLPSPFSVDRHESQRLSIQAESRWQLARCLFEKRDAIQANRAYEDALQSMALANQHAPEDASRWLLESKILRDYAIMLIRTSRVSDALKQLDRSTTLLERMNRINNPISSPPGELVGRIQPLQHWWNSRNAQTSAMRISGAAAQAIAFIEDAPSELREFAAQFQDHPVVMRLLSIEHFNRGLCQLDLGRFQESKESFVEAKRHLKTLVDLYPRLQELEKDYAGLCNCLGGVLLFLQQSEEGILCIQESLDINTRLAMRYPDRPEYKNEKAKSLSNLVSVLAKVQRLYEANAYGSELIDLKTQLYANFPGNADYSLSLAATLAIMGSVRGQLGLSDDSELLFEQSRSIYRELIARFPNVFVYRSGFANCLLSASDVASRREDWRSSIEYNSELIEAINGSFALAGPGESVLLGQAYFNQAVAFAKLGDLSTSRVCAQLGCNATVGWSTSDAYCQELLRRCSELADRR